MLITFSAALVVPRCHRGGRSGGPLSPVNGPRSEIHLADHVIDAPRCNAAHPHAPDHTFSSVFNVSLPHAETNLHEDAVKCRSAKKGTSAEHRAEKFRTLTTEVFGEPA